MQPNKPNMKHQSMSSRGICSDLNDISTTEKNLSTALQQETILLEGEITQLKLENSKLFQDCSKAEQLKGVNEELNCYLKKLHDDKLKTERVIETLELRLKDGEKKLAESNTHCWDIAEELKRIRISYADESNLRQQYQDQLAHITSQQNSADTMIKNLTSSLKNSEAVSHRTEEDTKRQLMLLQEEADSLREILQSSTEEKKILEANLQHTEHEREMEKHQVSAAISDLTEAVHGAKTRNEELSNALIEARNKLESLNEQNGRLEVRIQELEGIIESENIRLNEMVAEYELRGRMEAEDRDNLRGKIASASTQIQIFQTQLKESQTRNWESIQHEKQINNSLQNELDTTRSENEDLVSRVQILSNEQSSMKDLMHKEIAAATLISTSFRDELEKRLSELLELRQERDALSAEKEAFILVSTEREKTIKRNEVTFQKALEADRVRLQLEVKTSVSRLKGLEIEKEELLEENEQLSIKIMDMQKELSRMVDETAAHQKAHDSTSSRCIELQSRLNETVRELKDGTRNETALREEYTKSERNFKEEINRLEGLVKEAKKAAVTQVAQISNQIRIDSDEINALKRYNIELTESENRLVMEAETLRSELSFKNQQMEDLETKLGDDMLLLKADVKDSKSKYQQMAELKSKADMTTMEIQLLLTKTEKEVERLQQVVRDLEVQIKSNDVEKEHMNEKQSKVIKSYNDLKIKYVEAEEVLYKLKKDYEELSEEYAKAEREGLAEARGLRVTLSATNIELSDTKSILELQTKELDDIKHNLVKLQTSSTASINALIDELKVTEDTFAEYRKTSQSEANDLQLRIAELNGVIELSKDNLEEIFIKSKADKSERDMRVFTLENEYSRMKTIISTKESRILELEKVHQENRNAIQKLKESISEQERVVQDQELAMQSELQIRKRLESKILSLEAAAAVEHVDNLASSKRLISSRSSNQLRENMSNNNNIGLERVHSPLKRQPFEELFDPNDSLYSKDTSSLIISGGESNMEKISSTLAAKASLSNSVSTSKLTLSQQARSVLNLSSGTPDKKKANKASKGLVNEVRETVSAASMRAAGSEADSSDFAEYESSMSDKNEYELSIERTQQFLRQRLAGKNTNASTATTSKGIAMSKSHVDKPNNAVSGGASYLFQDRDDVGEEAIHIPMPRLNPATPPNQE